MAQDLIPLNLPPGLFANGTDLQAAGRWRSGNLVRWHNGVMEPIGGWAKATAAQLDGFPRAMRAWRYGFTGRRAAIATNEKLYSYDGVGFADITPAGLAIGRADTLTGEGYGAGQFGTLTYGTARSLTGLSFEAATWTLGNWGDQLVALRRDEGTAYKWDPDTDVTAVAVTNAPTGSGLLVTDERHLMVFGADGDPRKVAWSDREDYTVWTASATNSAGDLLLSTQGRYMASATSRYGALVLTNIDAHVVRYVGQPLVYGIEREANNCGIFGPNALTETEKGLAWMGPDGFFLFAGYVAEIPCPVYDRVFGDFNEQQGIKIAAGGLAAFDEAWWFYPSAGSMENDRYVIWNYREDVWSFGALPRGAWIDQGVFGTPLAVGIDGYLYAHERGWQDDGSPRLNDVYVESAPVALGEGKQILHAVQLINDEGGDGYAVTAYAQFTPEGTETVHGPYQMRADGYTDVRLAGRQVRLRFEGTTDTRWRVGKLRARVAAGGKR